MAMRVISPLETMYVFLDFAFSDNLARCDSFSPTVDSIRIVLTCQYSTICRLKFFTC